MVTSCLNHVLPYLDQLRVNVVLLQLLLAAARPCLAADHFACFEKSLGNAKHTTARGKLLPIMAVRGVNLSFLEEGL